LGSFPFFPHLREPFDGIALGPPGNFALAAEGQDDDGRNIGEKMERQEQPERKLGIFFT
jgi:hypothetical protein